MRRRLLYAPLPLLVLLALTEALGRLKPDVNAATLARVYEPGVVLVAEQGDLRATARPELHPQQWAAAASGYRVAFVGDSTVWGQLPDAFEQGLMVPGSTVEVLNLGIRGAGSDRARIAAEAALAQDLDLLVVYVGHNEVTEARLNPLSTRPFWQRRATAALLRSGTARLLGSVLDPVRAAALPRNDSIRASGDAAARPLTPEEWAPIAVSYRRNLEAICELAAGVPVAFVAPISSLVNPGEAPDGGTADLKDAIMAGLSAARLGDPIDALGWGDRMVGYYPTFGPPHALRGVALLGIERREEALDELREARRLDAQPARATEAHWEIVRSVAEGCGATFVSTEAGFLEDPRYLSVEDPLFMDRVHPTLPGNVLLAGIIAAQSPVPLGATFDPTHITLTPPADEASRGWKVLDQLWR